MTAHKGFLGIRAVLIGILLFSCLGAIAQAQTILTGTVTSASGEKMEGVTVSARRIGSNFTTTVFTDASGQYYFPSMDSGRYRFWAQAVTYDAAIVDEMPLSGAVVQQDVVLKPLQNFEKQLRGDEVMMSLPGDTPHDMKMKEVLHVNCYGGCHSPSQIMKDRFDEKGWKAIINQMSKETSGGTYFTAEDRNPAPVLQYWKSELAAWLAKVRGPAPTALKYKTRPRPTGDAALAVYREYDTTKPGFGLPLYNDGSLWQLGMPNKTDGRGQGLLRATVDVEGNPWFSGGVFDYWSFGKIDWKTGKLTAYKVKSPETGSVASGGEIFADREGNIWTRAAKYLVNVDKVGTMKLIAQPDPATVPAPALGAQTNNLRVWYEEYVPVVCTNGNCKTPPNRLWMYEPKTQKWAVYNNIRSAADNNNDGSSSDAIEEVYNLTSGGDNFGNGWWSHFASDSVVEANGEDGKVYSVKLPPRDNPAWKLFTGDDRKVFEMDGGADGHGRGDPSHHLVRQVGAGPGPTDSMWGTGWLSGDLLRVNIQTHKTSLYKAPLPYCGGYHAVVDPLGNVWSVCHSADYVRRFDPKTQKWTLFDLPVLGVDSHGMGVAPVLVNGRVRIVLPSWTTSKAILLEVRSKEDVQALKAEVQKASMGTVAQK